MDHEKLSICNPYPQRLPGPQLLHHLVTSSTDATALEYLYEDEQLSYSYSYLQDASSKLSQVVGSFYADADPVEDIVVPVWMPQCPHLYISLLAILKAGGAFCPLNPEAPSERLKFILDDVSAKVVLTTRQLEHQVPSECGVEVIVVDEESSHINCSCKSNRIPSSTSLAYVMYTSGSSGIPKGVGVTHSAAAQALLAHDRHIPDFSRFLQFAAPTFDVSVFEIFFPLFRGATLISVKREEMLSDLTGVMRRMKVDACELTPTVAGSLLKRRQDVPTLRLLLTIGEMLKMPVIHEFGASNECEGLLWAMYGPTEATIHCTLQSNLPSTSLPGNIGRPLDTVSCFIIKPSDSLEQSQEFVILPKGEAGELAVGGYQLAREYINRPELTSSAFIDSPYGRVYRTGDRAVMKSDGTLECLGRLSDGQIKIRGQRIELGEIEHAALRTSGCHDANAIVVDSNLILFCAAEYDVTVTAIEDGCKSWLPKYMIPNEIILMDEFPRLASGKVDSKRLKEDFVTRKACQLDDDSNSKTNAQNIEIMRIVSETLDTKVNMQSVLTTSGLDSLSAIRLASTFRENGLDVPVSSILTLRTLEDLHTYLGNREKTKERALEVYPEKGYFGSILATLPQEVSSHCELYSVEHFMPCTSLQSAMLAQTNQDPILYCNEIMLRTVRHVSIQALFDSFQQVIQSHEGLRTGFAYVNGRYISIMFPVSRPHQIVVRSQFERHFSLRTAVDFLHPFKIQLKSCEKSGLVDILIQAHHAMYDGWSIDMLLSEVSQLLAQIPLPESSPFSLVAHFQNCHSDGSEDDSRAFWSEALLGWNKSPFPKLIGRVAPDQIETHGAFLNLSPSLVRTMAQQYGLSPQVLFQTALLLAWQGVTGQPDVLIGSVFSGRTIPINGIDRIFGPCIASMPLRVDLVKFKANIDVLRAVHTRNRSIMKHCDLPLSEICKLAGLKPVDALYDVLFVYQQSPYDFEGEDCIIQQVEHVDRIETRFLIEVEPRNDRYHLQITYHSAFANSSFVDHFSRQIRQLSSRILHDVNGMLDLTGIHEHGSMSIFKAKADINSEPSSVIALFDASVKRNPDAEALRVVASVEGKRFKVSTMTYTGLDQTANKISHAISAHGAEVGDIIAIIMDKSVTLYTTILGILKAGCAYLPILPNAPAHRIEEILRQSRTKYCILDKSIADLHLLPDMVAVIDVDDDQLATMPVHNLHLPSNADQLAYVIFTSGTSGIPKGVAVSQRNLASNIAHLATIYPNSSSQPRLLQACSHAFDVSAFEIFYSWYAGMSLCAVEHEIMFRDLEHAITELGVTHLSLTPTVASLIDPKNVPQVEFLVAAGELMTPTIVQKWGSLLFQGYGPSETTNICTVKQMSREETAEHLGWVLPNSSVVVLSPNSLDVLPFGWVGEFCFGGSQVANGYLNNAPLTAQKFIQHPSFGRIYRTGDIGRMLPDGSLVIIGRLDDQLKLRGQRIEAAEINSTLTNTTSVAAAVTMLTRNGADRSENLVTFYTVHEISEITEEKPIHPDLHQELFTALKCRLPSYMIPTYLIPISQIPRQSSGKVDIRILMQHFQSLGREYLEQASQASSGLEDDSEWTEHESIISEAIAESCNIEKTDIGRWTPFPTLGVDSISAIGIANLLSDRVGRRIPISAVLRNPTVVQLGHVLDTEETERNTTKHIESMITTLSNEVKSAISNDVLNIDSVLPCVPLQEAMLLQGQKAYYNKTLLRLRISPGNMQSHWKRVVRRHGILRTCFVTTTNVLYPIAQVVLQEWNVPWKFFEVTVPSLEGALREHHDSLPHPLNSWTPPYSLALIRYKGSNFLSFICHHALYDGIAIENIWREVEAMAHSRDLPPPVLYAPFIQKALSLPHDVESFWKEQFYGFEEWPTFSRSTSFCLNQCTHTISIDMSYREIQQKTKSIGVSLLALCQASWACVISAVFERPDIAFGNVINGRTLQLEGLDRLVAPCFNTIPLRMDISRSTQNMDLMKAFHNLNSRLMPYQFSPLKLIQKVAGTRRQKLFNTLLLLQQPLRDMDKSVWTLEEDAGNMDVPLACEVIPCPNLNSVFMNLHYDMDMLTNDQASTISDMFKYMLRSMACNAYDAVPARKSLPGAFCETLGGITIRKSRGNETASLMKRHVNWSDLESQIRNTIISVSGMPRHAVNRETTIFQLGLDSINAVQIASKLREQDLSVSSSDVVECASCERLAARIVSNTARLHRGHTSIDLASYQRAVMPEVLEKLPLSTDIETVLPCTNLQNAMLSKFFNASDGLYLNFLTYKIRGARGLHELEDAWRKLQQCHPMLRTGFLSTSEAESAFSMVRWKKESVECPLKILQDVDSLDFDFTKWKEDSRLLMHKSPASCFWRVMLREDKDGRTMHVALHHALYDATSLANMFHGLYLILRGKDVRFAEMEPALLKVLLRTRNQDPGTQYFWKQEAQNAVVNKFPTMTPLNVQDCHTITCRKILSISSADLQKATQDIGVSMQAAFQAAWARLLCSYLGESSVVFGVVFSGRTTDDTEQAPFPCLTTVPVVARAIPSNSGIMKSMMAYNTKLHRHQFSSLSSIQKWLGYAGTPVFDTVIVYQKILTTPSEAEWDLTLDEPSVEYTVSLEIEPTADDQLCIRVTTRTDVVPIEQAQLILSQFDAILTHLVKSPDATESELHLSESAIFSVTPARYSSLCSPVDLVHQFVEQKAETQPESPALEFVGSLNDKFHESKVWNYRQLDEMGNQVAHLLSEIVNVGDIVAIHFSKCPEAYFCILGILKTGCSFVALDPSAPEARKQFILQDSKAMCLCTNESFGKAGIGIPVINIGINSNRMASYPKSRFICEEPISPQSTCYCLYTSGTTGTPKGCEITHENTVQALMAFQDLFQGHWQSNSRWLQFAALHFDVSVLEQYWSWSVGITVVAAPKDLILDDLVGSINKLAITHIDLTPSLARLTHPDELPTLCKGVFITGGEQLNQEILDAWGSKAVIYNAYGPTEATIGVTMYQRVPVNGRPSNIGKQFPNVGSFVLRSGTEIPVLRGGVGELCVSGKLVGKGYLHRPELSEQKFPILSGFNNERIYRTGDLVRILHDGCFDFVGRADDQIKLRGQRLEIGEINHIICRETKGVKNVATLVVKNSDKDVLVAFLAAVDHHNSTILSVVEDPRDLAANARIACSKHLPGYMIPTYFVPLTYIPLSSNNKVEGKELKKLFTQLAQQDLMKFTGRDSSISDKPVDNPTLMAVIKVLAAFSSVAENEVSAATSVFDLGVDSLSALQLAASLKRNGIIGVTPAIIIRNPIVCDLAKAISMSQKSEGAHNDTRETSQRLQAWRHSYNGLVCRKLDLEPEDIEYIVPSSPIQEGMISAALAENSSRPYFNWFSIELPLDTSIVTVRQAWEKTVQDHSILRSVFLKTTDGYLQVAIKRVRHFWHCSYTSSDDEIEAVLDDEFSQWIVENSSNILSPLQLIHVVGPRSQSLRLHIFHGLYDGNSLELIKDYAWSIIKSNVPRVGPSFVDVLCLGPLRNFDFCRSFWEEHLRNWSFKPLTRQIARPKSATGIETSSMKLPANSFEKLRKDRNVTLQTIVLSIWTIILQSYTSKPVTMGVVVAGRAIGLPDVDRTIGPLFNTIPFFNESLKGLTWQRLVDRCYQFNVDTLSFQHVPLKNIQKWCSKSRPLFDNLFVFQQEQPKSVSTTIPWKFVEGRLNSIDYPLALEVTQTADGNLKIHLAALDGFVNLTTMEQMLHHFKQIVSTLHSEADLGKLSFPEAWSDHGIIEIAPVTEAIIISQPEWTQEALTLRSELSDLANVSLEEVHHATSIVELGIDSIDAIKISARMAKRGFRLSASQITRFQTISAIAAAAKPIATESTYERSLSSVLPQFQRRLHSYLQGTCVDLDAIELILPPTPLQQSMVAGMIQSNFEWYFNHDILELKPTTDMTRMESAWLEVIASSPILRTGFIEVEDNQIDAAYCQLVFKRCSTIIKVEEASDTRELYNTILRSQEKAQLGKGLKDLLQVALISTPNKAFMIISMAHGLYDGWSLDLLYGDLEAAYNGKLQPRPYSEILRTQPSLFMATDTDGFWKTYLSQAKPTVFSEKECLVAFQKSSAVFRRELVSSQPMSKIASFCKRNSLSLQTLCVSCWTAVVASLSKSLDVVFGVILSGRDFEGAEELLFPTMNSVAVRSILHGTTTSFLRYMENNLTEIKAYQRVPLREAQASAKFRGNQLYNSLFILQKSRKSIQSEPMWKSVDGRAAVEYPVCVEAATVDDDLIWKVACKGQFFSENDTEDILKKLNQAMKFFTTLEEREILSFDNHMVSICGLSETTMAESSATSADETRLIVINSDQLNSFTWDETTSRIRAVLSEVSAVPLDSVLASSTLYQLGLDSISAIKVSLRLRKAGINLPPRELLRARSLLDMVKCMETVQGPSPTSLGRDDWKLSLPVSQDTLLKPIGISTGDVEIILPATCMQVYMLSAWQNSNGSLFFPEFYHQITGKYTADQLHSTWNLLVKLVPILRTLVLPTGEFEVPWLQVTVRADALSTIRTFDHFVSFGLTESSSTNAWLLRFSIHHALYDGFSLPQIIRLYRELLNQAVASEEMALEVAVDSWAQFSILPTLQTERDSRKQFWQNYLRGHWLNSQTSDNLGLLPAQTTERVSYIRRQALHDTHMLQSHANSVGIGIQSLFLAAFAQSLLHQTIDDADPKSVVFGVYLANRAVQPDNLHGTYPTLNLVPIRVVLSNGSDVTSIALSIHNDLQLIQSDSRVQVGLWEIYNWTGIKIDVFVNFLSVLEDGQDEAEPGYSDFCRKEDFDQPVNTTKSMELLAQPWLQNNAVKDSYPASTDIEMSLCGQALDVAVFGSTQCLARDDAPRIVDRIVQNLKLWIDWSGNT